MCMLKSLSINEILLPRYLNCSSQSNSINKLSERDHSLLVKCNKLTFAKLSDQIQIGVSAIANLSEALKSFSRTVDRNFYQNKIEADTNEGHNCWENYKENIFIPITFRALAAISKNLEKRINEKSEDEYESSLTTALLWLLKILK